MVNQFLIYRLVCRGAAHSIVTKGGHYFTAMIDVQPFWSVLILPGQTIVQTKHKMKTYNTE